MGKHKVNEDQSLASGHSAQRGLCEHRSPLSALRERKVTGAADSAPTHIPAFLSLRFLQILRSTDDMTDLWSPGDRVENVDLSYF